MTRPLITTLLLAGLATGLSGCINGMFLGLIPVGPFYDGTIEDGVYTSPDESFSVSVPHFDDQYEARHMQVKENFDGLNAYVSFGPAAFDQSIYRIEIARKPSANAPDPDLRGAAKNLIASYGAQLESGYDSRPEPSGPLSDDTIAGQPAVHATLSQRVPAGRYLSDREALFTHEVWVIAFPGGLACAWVQVPEESRGFNGKRVTPRAFAESIVLR